MRGRCTRSSSRSRAAAAACLLLVSLCAGAGGADVPRRLAGLPLTEALARLQAEGLRIIYSSDLVHSDMRVVAEPTATWLHDVLEQVLAPHGLAVRVGPGGNLLVVRGGPAPVTVRLLSPLSGEVTAGEVEVAMEVNSTEPIDYVDLFVNGWPAARLRRAPWTTLVDVPDGGGGACRFTAVALTTTGGRATDSVVTRRVVHEDRVEVALRQVYVSVIPRDRTSPLAATDFHLFDDGVAQPLATFGRGDTPISAVLLIDASESMSRGELAVAFDAARKFLGRLGPQDEAAVLVFSERVLALTPFGPPEPGQVSSVAGTKAAGGTALDDHLYAALRLLDERAGRRVVVLLSDGADVTSTLTAADLRWKVQRSDAAVYWLRLRPDGESSFSSAWRDADGNDRELAGLEQVVAESGGRMEPVEKGIDLARAFTAVVAELREQYVLGYYPRDLHRDGRWRAVEVRATDGVRLRYRPGWVDR